MPFTVKQYYHNNATSAPVKILTDADKDEIVSALVPSIIRPTLSLIKKGNKQQSSNYRPISLTCILCKVLERWPSDKANHSCENML